MKAAELRKSILQAAMQGKLVLQDPSDEPASELLKRVKQEKEHLIRDGKIVKDKPLSPINEDSIPFDLPKGWIWCKLGNVIDIKSSKRIFESDYVSEGIPFYRSKEIGDLSRGENIISKFYIAEDKFNDIKNRFGSPQQGDILVTSVGTIGNCWVSDGREFYYKDGNVTQISATKNISSDFILFYLKSPLFFLQALGTVSGTAYSALTIVKFNNVLFPLPPFEEQERIATKLDELMTMCDELENAENELDALENKFAEYLPKSILQAAVQGKLVPQNSNDEPAIELLKRIKKEREQLICNGEIKKDKPLPPISEDEVSYDLPNGWVWCRLGDICVTNPRNQIDDDLDVSFTPMTLISSEYFGGHEQEIRKWIDVKRGFTHYAESDIVIAKITPCFQNGKSCIMKNLRNGYGAGTTELHVLRSILVLPNYILIFAKSSAFLMLGQENMTGTAGQQRVPTEFIKNCTFPLPPLAEQQRIVSKVNELMAMCEELKAVRTVPVKLDTPNIIQFPTSQKKDTIKKPDDYKIGIAARGNVDELSEQAAKDAAKLFEDDEDE